MVASIGTAILPPEDLSALNKIKADMAANYATAKVLDYKNGEEEYSLDPELVAAMAQSRDPAELQYYWQEWRNQAGKPIRDMYAEYVDYNNKAAQLNGYKDASEMWVASYETDQSESFIEDMDALWLSLKPLYEQLHAYVRNKLSHHYGTRYVRKTGPMPAYLLGDMWGQEWMNIGDLLKPYPNKPTIDVTEEMRSQGWDQVMMFEKADEFFQSMGMESVPQS